jgi:hypothetical protein
MSIYTHICLPFQTLTHFPLFGHKRLRIGVPVPPRTAEPQNKVVTL